MTRALTPDDIASAFEAACLAELDALKPGNVHRFGDGHGMSVADFEKSAHEAAPPLAQAPTVGLRIRHAAEATARVVGQNTNLGILLLCAPLAQAALDPSPGPLRDRLKSVLRNLDVEDARQTYAAIRLAQPGGMGASARHDLGAEPNVSLLEAMREAETRDRIAWNYTHAFADIFDLGVPLLRVASGHQPSQAFAIAELYLRLLSAIPDTLILRKHGSKIASQVIENASETLAAFQSAQSVPQRIGALLALDKSLKERGLNPGTTADLTVATLFAMAVERAEAAT